MIERERERERKKKKEREKKHILSILHMFFPVYSLFLKVRR